MKEGETQNKYYRSDGQAERELEEERDFVSAVLETEGALVMVLDLQGRILLFNRTCEEVSGYSFEEVRGRRPWELLLAPEDVEEVKSRFDLLLSGESSVECENSWLDRRGSAHRIDWRNTVLKDEEGAVSYVVGTGIEITKRKRTEERLERRLEIEKAVAAVSRLFNSVEPPDRNDALRAVGEAVGVDRAYVFRFRDGLAKMDNTHEWCAPGATPRIDTLQNLDSEAFPWWMERMRNGENVVVSETDALPAEAEAEKAFLKAQSIPSFIAVPIISDATGLVGFLAFEDAQRRREWLEEDIRALGVVANILSSHLEREKAREALWIGRERYRSLVENIDLGITLIDRDHNIVMANSAMSRILSKPLGEMIGRKCYLEFESREVICPHCPGVRAMASGLKEEVETRGARPDGSGVPVKLRAFPTFDAHGVSTGFIEVVEDISERKRAESYQALATRVLEILNWAGEDSHLVEEILRCVKEFTGFDAVGVRLQAGEDFPYFAVQGFSSDFVESESTLLQRIPGDEFIRDSEGRAALDCLCGKVLRGRTDPARPYFTESGSFWTNSTTEFLACAARGEIGDIVRGRCNAEGYESTALIPLRAEDEIIGLLHLSDRRRDLFTRETIRYFEGIGASVGVAIKRKKMAEERRRLEEQFLQSQKVEAIGRLAGGVAHDFNNILSVILSCSEIMLLQQAEGDPLRADAESIRAAAIKAASLTKQLLAFGRRQMLETRLVNLNSIVIEIEEMLRRLIGEDIELTSVLDSALATVSADPAQIEQIIMNLAVNARDAMPQGGRITIETANVELDEEYAARHVDLRPGLYAMLAVSDTGVGMSRETASHIFEPFFTTKEMGKGTGLGLSTVYGIVKQHNGHIWVYSEPRHGTAFKIYLPFAESGAATAEKSKDRLHADGGEGQTILLVEDEAPVRSVARRILESKGYRVIEAGGGEEALRICAEGAVRIDLLLTDVVMPGMYGSELFEKVSAIYPTIKVLYMSGYTDDSIVRHGVLEKEKQFIQKPFSANILAVRVHEALKDG